MTTADEVLILYKMYARALGNQNITISELEKDIAYNYLKRIVDNRCDWSPNQKETYKMLVDICKKYSE